MWKATSPATMCLILSFVATTAHACPAGTQFSAYNGSGLCVLPGGGKTAVVRCQVAIGACPQGTSREHKNSDPSRDYCCPYKPYVPFEVRGR
jgi:hypothetical protein